MPHVITGPGSITRRPDSISVDYTMSHCFGPYAIGDNTRGMLNRVWKVRTDGNNLWLARSTDSFVGYETETLLITLPPSEVPIRELDVAFDQNAQLVVCVERLTGPLDTPQIWLYWFDPVAFAYTFTFLANGRNPRAILDEPIPYSQTSDVLIWFFSDTFQVLAYRRQRDRYATEFYINRITADNKFVEDAYRSIDNRVHVLFSVHNIPQGIYDLDHVESTLYPFWPPAEPFVIGLVVLPTTKLALALIDYIAQTEPMTIGLTLGGSVGVFGVLENALIVYDQSALGIDEPESFKAGMMWMNMTLVVALIEHDQFLGEVDGLKAGMSFTSGELLVVLFDVMQPPDGLTAGLLITGGTLGP